jgi:hypothetical protein
LDTARTLFASERTTVLHRLLGGTNAFAFAIGMYLVIDPRHHLWSGGLAALLAALYAGSAILISRRRNDRTVEVIQYVITAVVLGAGGGVHSRFVVIPVYALEVAAGMGRPPRSPLRLDRIAGGAGMGRRGSAGDARGARLERCFRLHVLLNRRGSALALIARPLPSWRPVASADALSWPRHFTAWIFRFPIAHHEINDCSGRCCSPPRNREAALRFQRGLVITAARATFAIP